MRFKRSIVGETHLTRTTPSEPHSIEPELWNRTEIDIENQNCESVRLRMRISGIGEMQQWRTVTTMVDSVNPPEQAIGHGKVHVYDPSHHVPSVPLQLMDQHQKHENEIEEGESGDDEKFRILGHSMFLKRMRVGESVEK
ncbi:hypothetical protein LOK49_LG02G02091 [Camellia lanceoleosa]|uniref:Uncharacterized protein n=1 Tax=Camellia lanceoleosa TaxID=1840588 RepID=A0ACC0IV32_9ERIC|nr:hypothetical protein LOK49_LG02G02091 [Camellia lanceoleosa]